MLQTQVWQAAVVIVVTAVCEAVMISAMVRLLSRRATGRGVVRRGTALESGFVEGTLPEGARAFDAWAYRVTARFAGRVRVVVYPDSVAVAGPRVPRPIYEVWVWAQGLLLALVPGALAWALVSLEWRWLVAALGAFVVSYGIAFAGAGLWPGLGEILTEQGHFRALDFPRAAVREVDIGKGWSKGGWEIVLLPYKAGVDKMAQDRAVSFWVPDEDGREVRVAVDMYSPERARELAALLGADGTGPGAATGGVQVKEG